MKPSYLLETVGEKAQRVCSNENGRPRVREDRHPERGDPGERGDEKDRLEAESQADVLPDVSDGLPGQRNEIGDARDAVPEERRVGGFKGDVCSASHGDADGRGRECGSVVDPIADHGNGSFGFQSSDLGKFLVGQQTGA